MNEKRDFLIIPDLTARELRSVLDLAKTMKADPKRYAKALEGKELVMLFQKTSTRTRLSFEAGMHQLGGNAIFLDWTRTNLTLGSLEDESKSIARYVDAIMARVYKHEDLEAMAKASRVPVINGLSDTAHPCQALGDMLTIEEYCPSPLDIKVAFIGDGTDNVCMSLIEICVMLGVRLTVIAPPEYTVPETMLAWLETTDLDHLVTVTPDIETGIYGVDVIYTDTFVSMGQEDQAEQKITLLKPYQLNQAIVNLSGKNPYIMHCLPAHRNIEITSDVLDSTRSIVFDQAENRMHAQKALLVFLLNPGFEP